MVTQIRKRDGSIVEFNKEKIAGAINKAARSVGGSDEFLSQELAEKVVYELDRNMPYRIPSVEDIQDLVEKTLLQEGHHKTARTFIIYRENRRKVRENTRVMLNVEKTMQEYLGQIDWRVNENSNVGFSLGGLILYISGKITANYWLNNIYPPEIKNAHQNGDFHIHDLGMFSGYSFYRNEVIIVRNKIDKNPLLLSLEQFYNLVENESKSENGFELKYTNKYEVLDEKGWTNVRRVLRHRTNKPLISLNTMNGRNLIVTNDHPFITLEEEKRVIFCPACNSDLIVKNRTNKIGKDYFKCKSCEGRFGLEKDNVPDLKKRKEIYSGDIKLTNYALTPSFELHAIEEGSISEKDGWFIGLFIAEGYTKQKELVFELSNSPALTNLIDYLSNNNIEFNLNYNKSSKMLLIKEERNILRVKLDALSREMASLIKDIRPYAHNKNLPTNIFNLKKEVVGAMIAGVIDGDGVIRNDDPWVSRANLRMTSKTLLSQIQFWLEYQGINSSLLTIDSYGEREYKGSTIKPNKQLYSLTFYVPGIKKDLFKECLKIDEMFKYSKKEEYQKKDYSHFRKIELVKNDDEYVYDITTASQSFNCNNILAHNCAGWSLRQLLEEGFGGVYGQLVTVPPKHFDTVVGQMVNFLGTMQNEWAGAQALSSVDTYLAPFVRKDNMSYKEVKQQMQRLLFNIATPSRWGTQTPFINFTFDWTVPEDLADQNVILGGERLETKYKDYQYEMDMINKAFMECMMGGDASGRIFTFPIPTYNITKDFDWDNENANLLFEMTAKYGIPYFQNFINSSLKPTDVRSMCCRLQLDVRDLRSKTGGLFGSGENTGSIGVVTLNLPRLGYLSRDKQELLKRIGILLEMAHESLELKRKVVTKYMDSGLLPYSKRYLGTLENHFSTIGLVGMNECLRNFIKKDITTPEGKELALEILEFMRTRIKDFQEATGNIYNLEATPAEGTSYRLARMDKMRYPNILTAGEEGGEPYYTNSSQLPVGHTDDLFEAMDHQEELQCKYTGGTVFHAFLGEKVSSAEACKKLVKRIANTYKIPYYTISPTFSVCPTHGYISGEHFECPYEVVLERG